MAKILRRTKPIIYSIAKMMRKFTWVSRKILIHKNFRQELENSVNENIAMDIEQYVQSFPSHKHDLFLIPNGTIHSSGKDNMVLEISATPYIFTFKMYDWVRLDLEGDPAADKYRSCI